MFRALAALASAVAATVVAADVAAAPAASRVYDRTVVCATKVVAGERLVTIWISPTSGGATARTGELSITPGPPSSVFTGARVGMFAIAETFRGALVDRKQCKATQTRVPLTRKGLPGPPVAYTSHAVCPAPRRVLVRLRYTYVPGHRAGGFRVDGTLVAASLAVRAAGSGKPIAFGTLERGARSARLFTAGACETRA